MVDITDRDRDAFHSTAPRSQQNHNNEVKNTSTGSTVLSIAKVFLYMFVGLIITTVVAFGVGAIMFYQVGVLENENALPVYLGVIIATAIALLIDMIIINIVVIRGKHSVVVPGIIYCVLIGVAFSMLTLVIPWELIGMAFGITALAFLLMSLISFLSKGNMSPILVVIIGLSMGAGILALFNFLFGMLTGRVIAPLYWIVEFAIFALILFVTIFDLWRIKKIAENGAMSNNVALYCAFIMYTDFINVFIRVLYFLLIIFARSKR